MPSDFHQKSFRIKHDDDKFFSKLLSKETSKSNPSFRVYYGDVSSAVPFIWETRPGTPKHHLSSQNSYVIPPLTPPPSYYTANFDDSSKKQSRSKLLLHSLLRRVNPKKAHLPSHSHSSSSSLSSSSLSWSSSSHSSFSDPMSTPAYVRKRRRFSSWGSSSDETAAVDDRLREEGRFRGGRSALIVKKALLSIVGRGSAA